MKDNNLDLIISALNMMLNKNQDNTELDLTKEEDVQKFHELVNELKGNSWISTLVTGLIGEDNEFFDKLNTFADNYYQEAHKNDQPQIDRPSNHIPTNVGLQIHKLVQEYIDTMIKPYAKGILDNKSINDAYVGLYDFACWIFNKEK